MKLYIFIFAFSILPFMANAQPRVLDSLWEVLGNARTDSAQYEASSSLYNYYEELNRDSALFYAGYGLSLARKNNKLLNEATSNCRKAYQELNQGRFAQSLQSLLRGFSITEDPKTEKHSWIFDTLSSSRARRLNTLSYTHHIFGILMWRTQNTEQEIVHFKEAKRIAEEINNPIRSMLANMNLGRSYGVINKLDSALGFEDEAEKIAFRSGFKKQLSSLYLNKAVIFLKRGDTAVANGFFYKSIKWGREMNNLSGLIRANLDLENYHFIRGHTDSSFYYANQGLQVARSLGVISGSEYHVGTAYESLYRIYNSINQFDSAYKYQGLALAVKDSIYRNRIKSLAEFQSLTLREQFRLQNLEKEKVAYQNKIRTNVLLAGIGVLLLLAIIFFRNNRQKHKAKVKIEEAYDNLKATQQQLIQSEKMASLGELTAGIAHEIQNPLNFVNNFSEVNKELVDELQQELQSGKLDDAMAIANDIKENEQKINHHGKRADAIVKGMLQHSRSSDSGNGVREPTDINALADEYLRLAYHGLRAKDNSFNATLKTDFDKSIDKISIIPQDIGRVILNLITNAFYTVNEKKRQLIDGYEPTVWVSTKKVYGKSDSYRIEIKVKDNGNGISQKVLDKIFQPFFTTKPTGQGTGLGLSLSYDIVKTHGGELKVETKESQFAQFIILLPTN